MKLSKRILLCFRLKLVLILLLVIGVQGFSTTSKAFGEDNYTGILSYSKLTYLQEPYSGTFQIQLWNPVGSSIGPVDLTLILDPARRIQSTVKASFVRDDIVTVKFPITKAISSQINSMTEYYSPTIQIGDYTLKLPKFEYALSCYVSEKQEQIIGKNYPYPNTKINLTLADNCPFFNADKLSFTGDFTDMYPGSRRGSTFSLMRSDAVPSTFQARGEFPSLKDGVVSPYLRMLDFYGNTRIMELKPFIVSRNSDWTKKYKTCIYSSYQKTRCGPFNSVSLEICSPLEDFRISRWDGKKWTHNSEILSGVKDLKKCTSTKPYYYYEGNVGHESLKVSKLIRYTYLATPTQKSQVWTFTIKNVRS